MMKMTVWSVTVLCVCLLARASAEACSGPGDYLCPDNKCISKADLCDGYHDCADESDEQNCVDTILVYADKNNVYSRNINSKETTTIAEHIKYQVNGVAYTGEYAYWIESRNDSAVVAKAQIDGTEPKTVFKMHNIEEMTTLALDWLTGNIYVTKSDRRSVTVCRQHNPTCKEIISGNPTAVHHLALNPLQGVMYWSQDGADGESGIYTANMDGTEQRRLIEAISPAGLSLDFLEDRLYWASPLGKIHSIKLDGSDQQTVPIKSKIIKRRPYWVSVVEARIFLVRDNSRYIYIHNKYNGELITKIHVANIIHGIAAFHPSVTPSWKHACWDSGCSHLCILKGPSSYTCACGERQRLARNNHTCIGENDPEPDPSTPATTTATTTATPEVEHHEEEVSPEPLLNFALAADIVNVLKALPPNQKNRVKIRLLQALDHTQDAIQ